MANKKILTDLEIQGKLGVNNATPSGSVDIVESVSNATTDYGLKVDYTKASSAGGWATNLYAIHSHAKSSVASPNQTTNFSALWTKAEHTGTGLVYYLIGSTNRAVHNGSGNTGVIYGAFLEASIVGTGTGTHPYLIGTYSKAVMNNANATATTMQAAQVRGLITAGSVGTATGLHVEMDYTGGTITGDTEYIRIQNDAVTTSVSGTARAINSLTTSPSFFAGQLESTAFKVTGGTSSQFLKADGSIDSSTYMTGSGTSGNITIWNSASGLTEDTNIGWNFLSDTLTITGNVVTTDLSVTGLNDGYLPYHKTDALGMADSKIYTDGTNIGVGTTTLVSGATMSLLNGLSTSHIHLKAMNTAPFSRNSTGVLGEIRFTSNNLYVCYATNAWSKVVLATSW